MVNWGILPLNSYYCAMEPYNLQEENELCWDNEIAYFSISDQYWCNECGK